MNAQTLKENILSGALDMRLAKLYGSQASVLAAQRSARSSLQEALSFNIIYKEQVSLACSFFRQFFPLINIQF